MKTNSPLTFLLCLLLAVIPSCAVTRPAGRGLTHAGHTITNHAVRPMDSLLASKLPLPAKVGLWLPAYIIGVTGTAIGVPIGFLGSVLETERGTRNQ